MWTLDGEHVTQFGNTELPNGALPLRQPYGVLAWQDLVLVTEYDGRRLVVFDKAYNPLQARLGMRV